MVRCYGVPSKLILWGALPDCQQNPLLTPPLRDLFHDTLTVLLSESPPVPDAGHRRPVGLNRIHSRPSLMVAVWASVADDKGPLS